MILRSSFIFLCSTLLLNSQYIGAQQLLADFSSMSRDSVFKDPFDSNKNNWITDNEYINGRFDKGHLVLKCRNFRGSAGLSYKSVKLDQSRDFEIESILEILKGSGALVIGMSDKFDHYRVEITDKNDLVVVKNTISKNKIEKLFNVSNNTLIKAGTPAKITIRKLNNIYYLFVNDSFVKEFNNIKPEGNQIGFNVGVNSEVSVDYLNVSYLQKKASPVSPPKAVATLITWTSPSAERTNWQEFTARVKAKVKTKSPIEKVTFYVNGTQQGEGTFQPVSGEDGSYNIDKLINLNPKENEVYFLISDINKSTTKSDIRYFINPEAVLPEISWGYPADAASSVNNDKISVEICIKSPSGLKSAKIFVNGENQGEDNIFQSSGLVGCDIKWKRPVFLKEGENNIYILATNAAGSTPSEKRIIFFNKAIAEKRIGLVFGNSEYGNKVSLKNPLNDANLMEATLKELGFDVIKRLNAGKNEMEQAIREFSQRLSGYNVALLYYAGHGLQVDGMNYLIPTDAKMVEKNDCKFEAVAVTFITDEFKKHPANTNIVILDACRNDPYRSWVRGDESGFKALSPINGTIISFATSEGATAADGNGANGLFTEELVKQMTVTQPIESVFKQTRKRVIERSKGMQTPTEWTYLTGDFYFKR